MSLTSFGSAAVKSFLTNEEMEAWKCIAIGMMSEKETTGDGKIEGLTGDRKNTQLDG